jgi:hypothetical protein
VWCSLVLVIRGEGSGLAAIRACHPRGNFGLREQLWTREKQGCQDLGSSGALAVGVTRSTTTNSHLLGTEAINKTAAPLQRRVDGGTNIVCTDYRFQRRPLIARAEIEPLPSNISPVPERRPRDPEWIQHTNVMLKNSTKLEARRS